MEHLRQRGRIAKSGRGGGPGGLRLGPLLEHTLGVVCALLLLGLVAVTCIDVAGRYFFDAPLSGAFEVTEIMLAALVFSALPLTTERREHVEVDLLRMLLGPAANRLLGFFAGLFSLALLTTFAWRLFSHAMGAAEDGAVTNALSIPLAPFGFLAALSCLLSAGVAFTRGTQDESESDRPDDGEDAP